MKVLLTPEAEVDLEGIGDRIADRNPARAVTYVRELRDRAKRIGEFPHAGPPRPQWGEGIRIAVHGKYLIVYRVRNETAQILRVVHGAHAILMRCPRKSRFPTEVLVPRGQPRGV
jgi:plasmid stabilization system protein ParE